MEIYRDFLHTYTQNSKRKSLNVSQFTRALRPEELGDESCLKEFRDGKTQTGVTHRLSADAFNPNHVRLVDPAHYKIRDPGDGIKRGESVHDAVKAGFAAGIFTFSEVVFNEMHTRAGFSVSFVCGGVCGNGHTVIYELTQGHWRQIAVCGIWVS